MSQISFNQDSQLINDDEAGPSSAGTVNRRLFGTPFPTGRSRIASTPFAAAASSGSHQHPVDALHEIGLNTRKRRLEDLFGDIRDIEEEQADDHIMFQAITKKMRSEEEIDLELIELILEKRKRLLAELNPLKNTNLDRLEALHKFKMQNLSYSVPKYPFTAIRRSDAERIYVRTHSEDFETQQIDAIYFANGNFGGLLGEAREDVWSKAQEIVSVNIIYIFVFTILFNQFDVLLQTNARLNAAQTVPLPIVVEVELPAAADGDDGDLWVEKYRPRKYLDLLSDESTNRSLLSWLKMWDKIVFNRYVLFYLFLSQNPRYFLVKKN